MNKKDLVRSVWKRADGYTLKQCREIIDFTFDVIFDELEAHGSVNIPNFGTFYVADRTGRTYHNNFTGLSSEVPTRPYPKFKASEWLKEQVTRTVSFRNRKL